MEFLTFGLIIFSIYLFISNNKIKKHSQIMETNYHEIYKKYSYLKSQQESYNLQTERVTTSRKKSENTINYTQEEIISFSEKKLEKQYLYPKKDVEDKSHFFYGKKVVITGDFKYFADRNEISKLLWEVGADVDTGVGKKTQVLIVGNNPGPSKIMTAEDMGLDLVTENEFLKLFKLV
ncbi:BRCT domain-containing protein [Flavobacterium urumqiense]|uniref:BRCA1 C Terminus (BRCT) domain-containing protein n=1 Tax=Flavobacterium urumqiense TaxID=935224 RepID=A0A1H5Z4Y2_9FLAO|nr:BRCT domain-containing protein [Flavobacterium urumqiense]SEG31110.1 BRCA1 C Terminus (BRCT) domain-containing protein [Flavobacterium urumqiense]